jgi:hypothetical protein
MTGGVFYRQSTDRRFGTAARTAQERAGGYICSIATNLFHKGRSVD